MIYVHEDNLYKKKKKFSRRKKQKHKINYPESNLGKQTGTHDSTPLKASELLTRLIIK